MQGLVSATTCATFTPSPPSTRCSSATTIAPVSAAAFAIASRSSGFTVCMSITRTLTPSASSASAATSACATSSPSALLVTSVPAADSIPWPHPAQDRDLARHREAGSHRHHIRFRDPAEEDSLRNLLGEVGGHRGLGAVGVHHHRVLVLAPQLHQRASEGLAGRRSQLHFELRA